MTSNRYRILVVDDEPDIRQLIGQLLTDDDYFVTEVHDAAAARTAVRLESFDAILLDIWMPGIDGITLLKEWKDANLDIPVIMMSAHGSIDTAVEATRLGALDFLEKPFSSGRLSVTVRNAVSSRHQKTSQLPVVEKQSDKTKMVGSSIVMKVLREQIRDVAATNCKVMVTGESGSGRKLVGRLIHESRFDPDSSFVVLDWLANPPRRETVSKVLESAMNGTLLIPSLDAYDGYTQTRLLGLLNEIDSMDPDSGNSVPTIITTVSSDIKSRLESGEIRSDIYQLLSELTIEVPPLRQRPEDIPELVGYLSDRFSQNENLPYKRVSTAALNVLRNHTWNGNVQELKNVLHQTVLYGSDEMITGVDIEVQIEQSKIESASHSSALRFSDAELMLPFRDARDQFERRYLLHNLKICSTFTEMAGRTGLHRSSLFRKLKEHGIEIVPSGEAQESKDESLT